MRVTMRTHVPPNSGMARTITTLLVVVGIIITLCSLPGLIHYLQIKDELVETSATIDYIEVDRHNDDVDFTVYVSYSYGGREYENVRLDHWSSGMQEGDTVTVRIHPDEPARIYSSAVWVFTLFGVLYTSISLTIWFLVRKSRKQDNPEPWEQTWN